MTRHGADGGVVWRPVPLITGQWRFGGAIGIDLGGRGIKLCIPPDRLRRSARRRAPAGMFAHAPTPADGAYAAATPSLIARLLADAPLRRQPRRHAAVVALPASLTRDCIRPCPPATDPVAAIRHLRAELARHMELPVAEGAVDFLASGGGDGVRVVAARREAVAGVARLVDEVGLRPAAVDAAGFALERLAALHAGANAMGVVDLGVAESRVALARRGEGLGHRTAGREPETIRAAVSALEAEAGERAAAVMVVGGGASAEAAGRLGGSLARPCRAAGSWAPLWLAWTLALRREAI